MPPGGVLERDQLGKPVDTERAGPLRAGDVVRRRIDAGLWALGTLTIAYGLVLLITLASRA